MELKKANKMSSVAKERLTPSDLDFEIVKNKMTKALLLFSEGLDSILAGKILKEQGIHITAVNIYTFFGWELKKIQKKYYKKIEEIRQRPLIVYITSSRQNASGQMASDVIPQFIKQLLMLPMIANY